MLLLKPGVRVRRVQPEITLAIHVVCAAFASIGEDCIITSLTEGKHEPGSLHYRGLAADFRLKHLPSKAVKQRVVGFIQEALGPDYDVIWEDPDGDNEHLHVEFDPEGADR